MLLCVLVTFFIRMAPAQAAFEGDWPCIQRKVGELTAAQMWDGPDLDTAGYWRTDPTIAGLAAELAQRRMPLDEAAARIARFAAEAGRERDVKLTALFARDPRRGLIERHA